MDWVPIGPTKSSQVLARLIRGLPGEAHNESTRYIIYRVGPMLGQNNLDKLKNAPESQFYGEKVPRKF